jgi:O-antigen/teichoic acid export membrane protein
MGLSLATPKFIVDLRVKNKSKQIKNLLFGIMIVQFILSLTIVLLVITSSGFLSKHYFGFNSFYYLLLLGIWFLTVPLASLIMHAFIGFQKYGYSASLDFVRVSFIVILTFILFKLEKGVYSPMIAYAFVNIFLFIFYFPFVKKILKKVLHKKFSFDKKIIKSTLNYGFILTFSGVSWVLLTQTDTLLLTYFKGVEAVGLYQIALPLAGICLYLVNAILLVAYPMSSELFARKKMNELSSGITIFYKYMLFIMLPVVILLFSFADLAIVLLFGTKYLGAKIPLQILAIGTLFSSYTLFNNGILSSIGESRKAAKLMFITAILNMVLNIILINIFGIIGAALATSTSFLFSLIISANYLKKYVSFKVPIFKWMVNILIGLMTLGVIYYSKQLINTNLILELIIIFAISGTFYICSAILTKIISYKEIKGMISTMFAK